MNKDYEQRLRTYYEARGIPSIHADAAMKLTEATSSIPVGVSWGHFSEIDDGYGHVDEVEIHWLAIFISGLFIGIVIAAVVCLVPW